MQKDLRFIVVAALIALGVWGWTVVFPPPQKVIRSQLSKLSATLSFEPKDGELAKAYQAQKLPEFFTTDATAEVEVRGFGKRTIERDELQQTALAFMHSLRGVKVELLDINVTLDADKQTAVANLTGKATVTGEPDFYVQEFNFKLRKVEG